MVILLAAATTVAVVGTVLYQSAKKKSALRRRHGRRDRWAAEARKNAWMSRFRWRRAGCKRLTYQRRRMKSKH